MKPLNSEHVRVLKNLCVIKRCPQLGGSLTKIDIFETKHFVRYKACLLFGMSVIGRFYCTYTELHFLSIYVYCYFSMLLSGAVVKWLLLQHNFTQQSLNSDSAYDQILPMACRKFAMVRISDNWYWPEIRPKVIRRSTISQKQINFTTSWQRFNLFTTAIWYMFLVLLW